MPSKTILRLLTLFVAAFALSTPLLAQDDSPSVAEAARRARQQKQDAAKPAHVIDNAAIPPSPAASNSAPAPAPPASHANSAKPAESASASAEAPKQDPDNGDDEKQKAEIDALKKEIADKLAKVTLQQRDTALAQDTFLSNPDHDHDKAGKEKIDSMQSDLNQLQAELNELQVKLAALAPASDQKTPESSKP
jgi:hypothetical protein